jgi:ribonuclease HII
MSQYLVGIDEAGRGPLAGPVSLAAVSWKLGQHKLMTKKFAGLRDSKQLSPRERERWYRLMLKEKQAGNLNFACAYASNLQIDKRGIVWGIKSALRRALGVLELKPGQTKILLDGSLKAPPEYREQKTIIRGDEKVRIIAMASVVAKVRRDRLMARLAKQLPDYGFAIHKGYGTRAHYAALRRLGPSPLHRRSFLRDWQG